MWAVNWQNFILTLSVLFAILFIFALLNHFIKRIKTINITLRGTFVLLYIGISSSVLLKMQNLEAHGILLAVVYITIGFGLIKLIDVVINDIYLNRKYRNFSIPKLIRNVIVLIAYIITFFGILKSTIGFDIAPVLTTSAVVSMVIGLALQDTLTNFIAGIVLHMEKTFKIGDYIKVNDIEGRVVEITWRTTKVRSMGNGIFTVPNSMIVKQPNINYDSIKEHLISVYFRTSHHDKPNKTIECVLDTAYKNIDVIKEPIPEVRLIKYNDFYFEYELRVWITDWDRRKAIETDLLRNIWYTFSRNDITIPIPTRDVYNRYVDLEEHDYKEMSVMLKNVDFFKNLNDETLKEIAKKIKRKLFGKGETLFFQGDKGNSFFIINKGKVGIIINNEVVANLKKGDFFGEMSLFTGKDRTATVRTMEDSEFFVIDKEGFAEIIMNDAEIAEHISKSIAEREIENEKLKKTSTKTSSQTDISEMKKKKGIILNMIKEFFDI